ncbi:MAG: hypothetical protein U1F59_05995 [Candidatus Competibacteraceae bacterium]
MGIEVIQDQANLFGGREVLIDQPPHLLGKIGLGPPGCDVDVAPTAQRLDKQKQIGGAFLFASGVGSAPAAGLGRVR